MLEPQINPPNSLTKFSLRGVIIPVDLPDLKNISALSQVEREIFRLHYGYVWMGDDSSPLSYKGSLRLSRQEIATKKGKKVSWIYQHLQRAILKLWAPGKSKDVTAITPAVSVSTPIPADPIISPPIASLAPVTIRPTRTVNPPVRPICEQIPKDKTETYADLLIWLWHPEQADIFRSFHGVLQRCRKNTWYHTLPLDTQIFGSYTSGSIWSQILLLVRYFDRGKTFEKFIEETWPSPLAPKPKPLRPPPSFTRPIPPPLPEWPPVVPLVEPEAPAIKPPPVLLFGLSIPEFSDYKAFIAWASREDKIVEPLITFYSAFRESPKQAVKPGSLDLIRLWRDSDAWKLLLYGSRLRQQTDMGQVLLDICDIREEILPVHLTGTPEPDLGKEIAPEFEELDIDTAYLQLLDTVQKNQKWIEKIRALCALHTGCNYAEFVRALNTFRTTEIWDAVSNLCGIANEVGERDEGSSFKEKSSLQVLFGFAWHEFRDEDRTPYLQYPDWKSRIGELLVNRGHTADEIHEIITLGNTEMDTCLKRILLQVPLKKKHWVGYEEENAAEVSLYAVVVELVRLDKSGQKKYDGKVEHKEIRSKLKHIKFPEEETQ